MKRSGLFAIVILALAGFHGAALGCMPNVVSEDYLGTINSRLPTNDVTALAADQKGNIFVGTKDKGLVVLVAGGKEAFTLVDETKALSFNAIHCLRVDTNNRLLIGTAGGMNYLDLDSLSLQSKFYAEDGLKDNIVLSLGQKPPNNALWAGTTLGLVRKDGGFQRFTRSEGFTSDIISALSIDFEGKTWAGTSDGLFVQNGPTFKKIALLDRDAVASHWVNCLSQLPPEAADFFRKLKVMINAISSGVTKRKQALTTPLDFQALLAQWDESQKRPALFAGTNDGLFKVPVDGSPSEKVLDGWFTAMAVNANGNIFVGNTDFTVFPMGVTAEMFPGFQIGELIRGKLRTMIKEQLQDQSREPEKTDLITPRIKEISQFQRMSDEQIDQWVNTTLLSKEISAMCFTQAGALLIGIKEGGLFRFTPTLINDDSVHYALEGYRQEMVQEAIQNGQEPKPVENPLKIKTPQPEVPAEIKAKVSSSSLIARTGEVKNIWLGKLSQLEDEDCKVVGEFIGHYACEPCVHNLSRLLPYDPFIVVILEPKKGN